MSPTNWGATASLSRRTSKLSGGAMRQGLVRVDAMALQINPDLDVALDKSQPGQSEARQ
jgi:ABC-type cobalamin transport system ATPase subunit